MQIDDSLLEAVDKLYRPTIKNIDAKHPKLLILFSAPPSSGKSTIAQAIEDHFKAIRLEADAIRALAAKINPESDLAWKSELANRYIDYLRPQLAKDSPNGLWIIDSTIDMHHQKIFDFAKEQGFDMLVLAIKIPESLRRQWIIETGDRPWATAEKYIETMPHRKRQNEEFLARHKADFYIEQPGFKIEDIYDCISKKLALPSHHSIN